MKHDGMSLESSAGRRSTPLARVKIPLLASAHPLQHVQCVSIPSTLARRQHKGRDVCWNAFWISTCGVL